ncbi:hypothetical protein P8452_22547 [Trifolium repens]|nr:hypothetical protein P8452_22547 [Trifolium repens]
MLSFVGVFDVLIPTFALKETARCLFHPDEEGARGPFTAAGCIFEVKIVGGHVAFSQPTVDPLLTTLLTILAVQQLLSREIDPLHSQVLSITYVQVGCALNVFGKHVRLRSQSTASMHHFKQRLKEV